MVLYYNYYNDECKYIIYQMNTIIVRTKIILLFVLQDVKYILIYMVEGFNNVIFILKTFCKI